MAQAKRPKGISPEKLEALDKDITGPAQEAAAKALRAKLPFEPLPDVPPEARAQAPKSVGITYPNGHKAKVVDDPADPGHFGFSASAPTGEPVDVPGVPGMAGGQATLEPLDVPKALKGLGELDRKVALSFSERLAEGRRHAFTGMG